MGHRFRFIGRQEGRCWIIEGDEARHLKNVLRLGVGDELEVTDARGRFAVGRITETMGGRVTVQVETVVEESEPPIKVAVAVGALKSGSIDDLLAPLVELGVDQVHVFMQDSVAKSRLTDKVLARWQRVMTQALKQCKRTRLPELCQHRSVKELATRISDQFRRRILLDANGSTHLAEALWETRPASFEDGGDNLLFVVGGEKGFSEREFEDLKGLGFQPVRFGTPVLRATTAVIAAAAIAVSFRAHWVGSVRAAVNR